MKNLRYIILFVLAIFSCQNILAQGVKLFKKDKAVVAIPYEKLDSIVAYNYHVDETIPNWVDLGLPSGIKWASKNIGAESPEQLGSTFPWGAINPNGSGMKPVENIAGNVKYDAATATLGAPARMPNFDEIRELIDNCTSVWTTLNGVKGRLVTGPNGNSIFLPAGFKRMVASKVEDGEFGCYWSASPNGYYEDKAYFIDLNSNCFFFGWRSYTNRLHVRAVKY